MIAYWYKTYIRHFGKEVKKKKKKSKVVTTGIRPVVIVQLTLFFTSFHFFAKTLYVGFVLLGNLLGIAFLFHD